ncbi:hypothetical protein lerEdw1_015781 [Lerista edwardsae]|nr:hypothetical protein lerEdw1_015781 [Lerista edwardsae]
MEMEEERARASKRTSPLLLMLARARQAESERRRCWGLLSCFSLLLRCRMTGKTSEDGVEKHEEGEEEEANEADFNTQRSDSTYGTESLGALGGAHPTPEEESRTWSFSMKSQEEAEHLVNCIFTISLAVPLIPPTHRPWMTSRQDVQRTGSKMKEGVIPKMHRFYHMEYILLPDDTEPRKLDLVLFGPVAKLYLETEPKVVRTWLENEQIWVSWNHSIEINVTNDFLIKLRDHKIQLRLWDTKEKVCSKARFGKTKVALPHLEPGEENMVKRMVMSIREFAERNEPKASYTKTRIAEESPVQQKSASSTVAAARSKEETPTTTAVPGASRRTSAVQPRRASSAQPFPRTSSSQQGSVTEDVPATSRRTSSIPRSRRTSSLPQSHRNSSVPQPHRNSSVPRTSSVRPPTKVEEMHSLSAISLSGSIPSSLREKTILEGRMLKQRRGSVRPTTKPSTAHRSSLGKNVEASEKRDSMQSAGRTGFISVVFACLIVRKEEKPRKKLQYSFRKKAKIIQRGSCYSTCKEVWNSTSTAGPHASSVSSNSFKKIIGSRVICYRNPSDSLGLPVEELQQMAVFTSVETSAQSEISLGTCPADEVPLEKGKDEEFSQEHLNGSLIGCLLQKPEALSDNSREVTLVWRLYCSHYCVLKLKPSQPHRLADRVSAILTGEHYLASRLVDKSPKLLDAYLSFSVEEPLLSERQKHELNPLIIRIKSARCLPSTPVPVEVLQSSCVPVYCKYAFHNLPPHHTRGRDHGTEVFFKDINVILAGTIDPGEFREYLRGPPLEIEVHDRDKKMETILSKPSLFGDEPGDNKLSSVSHAISRYMIQNPITDTQQIWHPYGIAKISLAELLLGEKNLNFYAPIHSCSVQDTSLCMEENVIQKAPGCDVTQKAPGCDVIKHQLPMGHYVCSESYLKVRVEITVPLPTEDETGDAEMAYSPYGCIIYIFDYKNASLLSYLMKEITEINAEALELSCYSPRLIQQSLNTLKLTSKIPLEDISKMDIITGFHILDGSIHLLVLEGLREKALKRMWNKKIDRIQEKKTGRLQVLYNSHVCFHQRLYVDLEAVLFHIRLCKPLSSIMKQPLLYIRDMVPPACFQALTKLDYICFSTKLRDVIHRDLLPSAEMITMLSREFGVPLNKNDLLVQQYSDIAELFEVPSKYLLKQGKRTLLDDHNEKYILRKREMERQSPQDHIQINIDNVDLLSKMVKKGAPQKIRAFPSDGKSIFNYSMQALNSAEIANKLLRREIAQVPERRYAYGHDYLSSMYNPVDEDSALKEAIDQSKEKWLTSRGFVYPGFKSSIESNVHPRRPDETRVEELMEKWQENRNFICMKLDRDRWTWDKRDIDFDIYKKPPQIIVVSDTFREEPPRDMRANTMLKVHRCCPATELIASGPKASCQVARLQGLLKDKPAKLSLKLQPTSIMGVLGDVVQDSICKGFVPGTDPNRSLKWNENTIPCHDRQYNLFKTLKGADFRLFIPNRSFHYKKFPLPPLKNKHLKVIKDEDTATIAPQLKDLVDDV